MAVFALSSVARHLEKAFKKQNAPTELTAEALSERERPGYLDERT